MNTHNKPSHPVRCSLFTVHSQAQRGVTILLVVAFMGVFAIIVDTITSYVFQQSRYGRALYTREQALHVAEAGLEYYKWALAHSLVGQEDTAVKTFTGNDPEGGGIGTASITPSPSLQCGVVQWVDLSSRGTADLNPLFPRTLNVRYMRPSVAEYSYILNANALFTAVSSGPMHSNGGIRMDGANDADVTSPQSTWNCTTSYGCNPANSSAPGVLGSGSGFALWRWGATVPNISFVNMAPDYDTLQTYAATSGVYLPYTLSGNTVGGSNQRGYHLIFKSDGTVDVWRVTSTVAADSQHSDNLTSPATWHVDYHIIPTGGEVFVGNYGIPSGCSLIYSEAKTWIEGTIVGKVTVIAADEGSFTPDVILAGDITYLSATGSSGLTAIAERSVLIPLDSADTMSVRGIFVALTGYFGRNYYTNSGTHKVPTSPVDYSSYVIQSTLNRFGTTVSTLRPGTRWTSSGVLISGYNTGTISYDRVLAFSPPPFTPTVSTDYEFSLWREE